MACDRERFSFVDDWADSAGVCWEEPPATVRDDWFLGSALQLYDLATFASERGACRFVDTIWTRHLHILPPNLYWEVHNQLFHAIWSAPTPAFEAVGDFVSRLLSHFGIAAEDLILVSDCDEWARVLTPGQVVGESVPFAVDGNTVGRYAKLFVHRVDGVFPLLDLVLGDVAGRVVSEIHMNLSHVRVAAAEIPTIYAMACKRDAVAALGVSQEHTSLKRSSRTVRIIALVDAVRHAAAEGASFSGSGAGHVYKKMAKSLAEDLIVTRRTQALDVLGLPDEVTEFVAREVGRIEQLDLDLLQSVEPAYRRETLGVSDARLAIADGSATDPVVHVPEGAARYFTDLPLLGPMSVTDIDETLAGLVAGRTNQGRQ